MIPHKMMLMFTLTILTVAIAKDGKLVGFNVVVGGGSNDARRYLYLCSNEADDFGFVPLENTLDICGSGCYLQRDWGNRSNRKNAKTKYTLDRVGIDVFKAEVEKRAGAVLRKVALMNSRSVVTVSVGLKVVMVSTILAVY
ncbi:hypothetical protein OK016_10920 [Vibrio chagasii]|nr:hypothetical protein [Vibrio chagasii]